MNLKNHEEVQEEARLLLHYMTMYKTMLPEQVYGLMRGFHRDATRQVLVRLIYQRRLYFNTTAGCFQIRLSSEKPDIGMTKALWVLLDRLDDASSHTCGAAPVKLCFEENGELCSVLYCPKGGEAQTNRDLASIQTDHAHAIVIVDKAEQFQHLDCAETVEFCTVSESGKVTYY